VRASPGVAVIASAGVGGSAGNRAPLAPRFSVGVARESPGWRLSVSVSQRCRQVLLSVAAAEATFGPDLCPAAQPRPWRGAGRSPSLPRPRRRAHHMDMPRLRRDGVRAAAQHSLLDTRRAGEGQDLQPIASNAGRAR